MAHGPAEAFGVGLQDRDAPPVLDDVVHGGDIAGATGFVEGVFVLGDEAVLIAGQEPGADSGGGRAVAQRVR